MREGKGVTYAVLEVIEVSEDLGDLKGGGFR